MCYWGVEGDPMTIITHIVARYWAVTVVVLKPLPIPVQVMELLIVRVTERRCGQTRSLHFRWWCECCYSAPWMNLRRDVLLVDDGAGCCAAHIPHNRLTLLSAADQILPPFTVPVHWCIGFIHSLCVTFCACPVTPHAELLILMIVYLPTFCSIGYGTCYAILLPIVDAVAFGVNRCARCCTLRLTDVGAVCTVLVVTARSFTLLIVI